MKPQLRLPAALALACLSAPLWAHGTMEVPINRTYNCFKEGAESPKSAACQEARRVGGTQAMYDWNGINQNPQGDNHAAVVPDGKLCAGGQDKFKGFNLGRTDWPKTKLVPDASGNYEFVYHATAPHSTKYFKFYVTKNGWDQTKPLKWSDLDPQPFHTVTGNPPLDANKRYHMVAKLPAGKSGPHIIFNVWKRADSEEAFYSCSDVIFGDGTNPPEPPPVTNPWKEIGKVTAYENLPNNSTATLRVFDASGRDAETIPVKLDAVSGQMTNWPYELGVKVNATSKAIRIGVMNQKQRTVSITPEHSATANRVYLNDSYKGYTYQIDLKKGDGGINPPPVGDTWKEGLSYTAGQIVSYQGKKYRCLQPHTAWAGAGWTPSTQPALWAPA
ncbi:MULTISPECIES: lytic polysaccharide monooxygenase [Chromobacterium]|uniref:lytic polysaccharide monooxygenase n=1 Tax=Chromobacterium TaxID=535 RepID=UPI0018889F6A|nr:MULTISPECIES: lytic polysaccharide monooxygenase [Chromobacterium]QOZ82398.1 chitin-binding protein [Chromobacterium sp. Rain0013]WON82447.1 lytic polysaccharide monooxygenase [Chromobacterium haemolyticum]